MKNTIKKLLKRQPLVVVLIGMTFLLQGYGLQAQETSFDRISNRWTKAFLHNEYRQIDLGEVQPGWWSAMWELETVEGTTFKRIKNRWTDEYLHNEYRKIEMGEVQPGWWSAMWELETVEGTTFKRIKNRWTGAYLHNQNGKLELGEVQPGWWSAMWTFASVSEAENDPEEEPCSCLGKTFRTQSDHSWAEFRMPPAIVGQVIKIKGGAYNKYVFPKCNRVTWTDLTFRCDPRTCTWVKDRGNWDADALCHGSPGNSLYVKVGVR